MKKRIITPALALMIIAFIAGCNKDTDNAAKWVGVYSSPGSARDSINQVTITEVNSSTIKLQLQAKYAGVVYTVATIQRATLTTANTINVNETGNIAGLPNLYTFTGSGNLSGNAITVSGQGVNTTNSSDIRRYYFTGSK